MKNNTVLLVVDVQAGIVNDALYRKAEVLHNIKRLITRCRDTGVEVVYVQHDDGAGSDMAHGSHGWQIVNEVAPMPGERIFDKRYSSAFVKTGLRDYLQGKGITRIILVGLQTEYCMDATCKSAFEHGFTVLVPEHTNSTFDNGVLTASDLVEFYNKRIWHNRFATVLPIDKLEQTLSQTP